MQPESLRPDLSAPRKSGLFYGWYIVGSAFLANVAFSEQFSPSYGVFVYHMGQETGWGRTALAGVKTVGRLPEAFILPFLGPMLDRYGARWLMLGGAILYGTCLALVSTVTEIWQLYLYMGVLVPLGGAFFGGVVPAVVVANWFVLRRGRAIALVTMGTSFGTMVTPLAVSAMIEAWGWRQAWVALGLISVLLVMPAVVFVRRRPEDVGLKPDGLDPIPPAGPLPSAAEGFDRQREQRTRLLATDVTWSQRQVLRSRFLWLMAGAWGVLGFALASTNLHMIAFFQDLGHPLLIAAGAVTLRSAVALAVNPLWGFALDRAPVKMVASALFVTTAAALGMWLLPPSTPSLIAGLVLFGITSGGTQVASEVIWASYYGRLSLGAVRGIAFPIQTTVTALGPLTVGLLYDLSGSYASSFALMALTCTLAAGLVHLAQPPKQHRVIPS